MADVVTLAGKPLDEPTSDYDVSLVEILEIAIKEIKTGKVNSLALVMVHQVDDDKSIMQVETSWQGKRLWLLAGASRLTHRLNVDQDEELNAEQDP